MRKLYCGILIVLALLLGASTGVIMYKSLPYAGDMPSCGINFHYLRFKGGKSDGGVKEIADINLIVTPERLLMNGYINEGSAEMRINRIINLSPGLHYPGGISNVTSVIKQSDDTVGDSKQFDYIPQHGDPMKISLSARYNNSYLLSINDYRLGICTRLTL